MKATWFLSLFVLLVGLVGIVPAYAAENDCLYYFYGEDCAQCQEVDDYLTQLQIKYPDVHIERMEVYYERDKLDLLNKYFDAYGIGEQSQGIPAIFLADSYFVGKEPISTLLEQRILDNPDANCPAIRATTAVGVVGEFRSKNVLDTLTFGVVTGGALRNAINAGSIALLLILLAFLTSIKEKEDIAKKSIIFVVGAAIAYLLFGVGLFTTFISSTMSNFFVKLVGVLAVLFALLWMMGFFGGLHAFTRTPEGKRITFKVKWLESYATLGLVGFVASLFTFTFMDSSFIILRRLYEGEIGRIIVLPLIVYYVLILLIPLIILLLIGYFLRQTAESKAWEREKDNRKQAELWIKHHIKMLHFAYSIILLIAGLLLLFG